MLTMVAKPMGTVPRKRDWVGWRIISPQISGYMVYLAIDRERKRVKRTLRAKKMMDSQ